MSNWKKHIPLTMTIVAATLMFGLSAWQWERLEWKEKLVAKLEAAEKLPAKSGLPVVKDFKEIEFQRYKVRGTIIQPVQEFHVGPRYYLNKLGYHIHAPAALSDGRVVLVNLGWVPADKKDPHSRMLLPEKQQSWEVMVRVPPQPKLWTPTNRADKNFWFYPDIAAISETTGLTLEPVVLEVVGHVKEGIWPFPSNGKPELRNDHFGYAITWALIGVGVVGIYIAYRRKEKADANVSAS